MDKLDKKKAKSYNKMDSEEVEGLMHMRKRAFAIQNKKGKGSYSRIVNDELLLDEELNYDYDCEIYR